MRNKIVVFTISIIYLLILLLQREQALTQDLGRHIKLGEIIVNCHCVPKTNLFSFTQTDYPFVNHHWFSEVIFYYLFQLGGMNLIILFKMLLIILSFSIILYIALNKANSFFVFIFSFPYIFIFSERFDARPEIFSFLFLSLFLFLISRYKEKKFDKYLLLLPLIQLLWVNMHIYFIIGPVIFSFFILEEFLKYRKKTDRKLFVVFTLIIFSVFINPNFINGALLPLNVLKEYGYTIVENQSPFFLNTVFFNPRIVIFEIVGLLLIISFFLNYLRISIFQILLSIFAIAICLSQIRNFPIIILSTFAVICTNYSFFWEKVKNNISASQTNILKTSALTIAVIFIFFTVKNAVFSPIFGFTYIKGAEKGIKFMKENNIKGPIFNNFDIGSYLIFQMYPTEKVFVDGRPEAYPVSFFKTYIGMQYSQDIFEKEAIGYNINTIFFSHTDITPWARTFLSNIVKNDNWVPVYLDDWVIILLKNNNQNQALINKYKLKLQ